MKRYFVKPIGLKKKRYLPRSGPEDAIATEYLAKIVYEPEPEPYDSGLFDAQGNSLYVTNEIDPIGFIRRN